MKAAFKTILLIFLAVLLMAEVGLVFVLNRGDRDITEETAAPAATEAVATEATAAPTEAETIAPTETTAPTEPPVTEPPVTEPKEKHYTLSFAGDCTLGSQQKNWNNPVHFVQTIGENYDYPFDKVRTYFEEDDRSPSCFFL